MKSIIWIVIGTLLLVGQYAAAQPKSPVLERVRSAQSKGKAYVAPGLLKRLGDPEPSMQKVLKRGSLLNLDKKLLKELKTNRPDFVVLDLPIDGGRTLTLELVKNEVLAPGFKVTTSSPVAGVYEPNQSLFYQGVVRGQAASVAAISVVGDELMGVLDVDGIGNMVLGALENDAQGRYTIFRSQDLVHDMAMGCDTKDEIAPRVGNAAEQISLYAEDPTKCVNIYFECEYDMFLSRSSSVTSTVDFMTGIYNVVKTLYDNENVNTAISEIFVWTTPDDYPTTSTSDALYAFRAKRGTTFNGNLAHLVSRGAPSGGGVAFLNVTCSKSNAFAYSFINASYSSFPTYSWTVMVIAHEMGHNLGSSHTHACTWDVNNDGVANEMIDGCGPSRGYSEGSCPVAPLPTNGGTVMSYCHLVSGVGINLNNGFGPLPGARIRNRVYNGTCLTSCSTCSTGVSISSTPVSCPGSSDGSASASGTGGIAPYTYLWSNGSTASSISGLTAGTYTVTVRDQNGAGCAASTSVTVGGPAAWNITSSITPELVPGAGNGAIDITVSGGTPPYSYTWSNGQITQDLANIAGGSYTVTIRDSRACTTQRSYTVGSNGCGQQITAFPVSESFETGLGIFAQATNDNFDWIRQSGSTPNNRTGPTGAYHGTWYMYAQGKGNTGNASLVSPCLDLRNLTNPVVNFFYSMNGSQIGTLQLDVSINNGATWTTLWTLSGNQGTSWNPGTVSLNNFKSAYTKIRFLSVAGGNFGDIAIDGVQVNGQISNPCTPPELSFTQSNVSCSGGNNGSASVTASGGSAPYTYLWSNGGTASTINNLSAGTYQVTVTATGGCTVTGSATITQPSTLAAIASASPTSGPGASDGSITLTVSGGTQPYTYEWSNGATSRDIQNLVAGTYSVTVRDANSCMIQRSATVADGQGPVGCSNIITLAYTESFETNLGQWTQSASDQFDWRRNSGGTPTANTGPTAAAQGSFYLYTESNDGSSGARAIIESACLDLTGIANASFTFAWHMFGNQMGSLALEISDNGGSSWTQLWGRSGYNGTAWVLNQVVSLSDYAGKTVRFRFVGTLSNGVRGDMAIDHIRITAGSAVSQLMTVNESQEFEWKRVYPNPTEGQVQLEVYVPTATMARLSMMDATGRSSDMGSVPLSQGLNSVRVTLPARQSGMYIIRLQENGRSHTRQVMVMK